ncbi:MAG: hypothetical protein HYR56_25750 [Acidobacteria bacterium]|nr:hypothetical protein [Acidobacteriota bacterium]
MARMISLLRQIFTVVLLVALCLAKLALAQGTAFTYQGKLTDGANPTSGNFNQQFQLFDALTGDTQVGATFTNPTVAVTSGVFTVQLNFGCAYPLGFLSAYFLIST